MHFEANMRGQTVKIYYGINPQGQVAGVWMTLADGTCANDLTEAEEATAFKLACHHQANQPAHIDITSPHCSLYSSTDENERCPSVVLLHRDASSHQLLGYAHGRCLELVMLANLAASSTEGEAALREVCQHLWSGLETLAATLDVMATRMKKGAA